MRILLGLIVALCVVVSAAGASAAVPPGSSYGWAQPGTALVTTPFAQPPASIPIFAAAPVPTGLSGYVWVQPNVVVVTTPFAQPPASIPIG